MVVYIYHVIYPNTAGKKTTPYVTYGIVWSKSYAVYAIKPFSGVGYFFVVDVFATVFCESHRVRFLAKLKYEFDFIFFLFVYSHKPFSPNTSIHAMGYFYFDTWSDEQNVFFFAILFSAEWGNIISDSCLRWWQNELLMLLSDCIYRQNVLGQRMSNATEPVNSAPRGTFHIKDLTLICAGISYILLAELNSMPFDCRSLFVRHAKSIQVRQPDYVYDHYHFLRSTSII